MARKEIAEKLAARFAGLVVLPIDLKFQRRGDPAVDSICELFPELDIWPDPDRDQVRVIDECRKCNRIDYEVEGIELPSREEKIAERWELMPGAPRSPGAGIRLTQQMIGDRSFFSYGRKFLFCLEDVKTHIEAAGWTNIGFQEYGEIKG